MAEAILTRREGSALIAQINNSARLNAIAKEHCEALSAALGDASQDPSIRALIITGDETAFCAGADIVAAAQAAAAAQQSGETPNPAESTMLPQLNALVTEIQAAEVPVIAAVEGAAAGSGTRGQGLRRAALLAGLVGLPPVGCAARLVEGAGHFVTKHRC